MRTILITGSNGQLGNEIRLLEVTYPFYRFVFTDIDELDITNLDAIVSMMEAEKVDFVINCAAYTAVDRAETDYERAYLINATAPQNIGVAATRTGARVIHVSTDYVFNGCGHKPYSEDQPIDPQGAYGKTKADGEQLLIEACKASMVVRTSWLYSRFGNNFVKTMIRLGREREQLSVVFDQVGTPTYAADLAAALMQAVVFSETNPFPAGVYHYSNEGVCSWYDFTIKIHQLAGITGCNVRPIESNEYPVPAPRPHYSVLNKAKIKSTLGIEIAHWEASLRRCVEALES